MAFSGGTGLPAPTPVKAPGAAAKASFNQNFNKAFNARFNQNFNAKFNARFNAARPAKASTPAASTPAKPSPGPRMAGPGVPANSPLLNPNATLSGSSLYQAAKALAMSADQGTINELRSQAAQNDRQTQGAEGLTNQYFQGLGNFVNQGNTLQGQIASGLNQQLQQNAANEQQQLQQLQQNQTALMGQYSPQGQGGGLGTQGPGMQALTTELARQQGLAAQQNTNFQNFAATQGANYRDLSASNLGTYALQGQEDLSRIAQAGQVKNASINAKIGSTVQKENADIESALAKLRQGEITNQAARRLAGINQERANAEQQNANTNSGKLAATVQNNAATQALNRMKLTAVEKHQAAQDSISWAQLRQKTSNDRATQAYHDAQLNLKAAKGGGTGKTLTLDQQDRLYTQIGNISGLIKDGQGKGWSGTRIRAALETKYDPNLIDAAWSLLGNNGHLTVPIANKLRQEGLSIRYPVMPTPAPSYAPPPAGGVGHRG